MPNAADQRLHISDADMPRAIRKRHQSVDTFRFHEKHPEVTLDDWLRIARRVSGERAMARRRIYLDTKYWNFCRNAASGDKRRPAHRRIWTLLKMLVREGIIVCPYYYSTYCETLGQNARSRFRSSRVVDKLSCGLALIEHLNLITSEISHFVWTRLLGDRTLPPRKSFGFVPVTHFLGPAVPSRTSFPAELELTMQKSFLDFTSSMKATEMMWFFRDRPAKNDRRDFFWWATNLLCRRYRFQHEGRPFSHLLNTELEGTADLLAEEIRDFARDLQAKGIDLTLDLPDTSAADGHRSLAAIVVAGFQLGRITTELPSVHIPAALHAAMRFHGREFDRNDHHDFLHASAALGYCDAFFTERKLANLLSNSPLSLASDYGCKVISNDDQVITYLETLKPACTTHTLP